LGFRDVALAAGGVHHFADTAEHDKMSVGLEVAGVAGVQPAVDQRFVACLRIVEIAVDHGTRLDLDLAIVGDADLHARHRFADRMQLDFAVVLRGRQRAALGLAVELL